MALSRLQAIVTHLDFPGTKAASSQQDKGALLTAHKPRTSTQVAAELIEFLLPTFLTGPELRLKLDRIVGPHTWTNSLAEEVIKTLASALQHRLDELGPVVSKAYDRSLEAASEVQGFVLENPMRFTIIALGVLAIVAPGILAALGFGADGPILGSFAAGWHSTYGAHLPKGSLFSFLQQLGMKWNWAVVLV